MSGAGGGLIIECIFLFASWLARYQGDLKAEVYDSPLFTARSHVPYMYLMKKVMGYNLNNIRDGKGHEIIIKSIKRVAEKRET